MAERAGSEAAEPVEGCYPSGARPSRAEHGRRPPPPPVATAAAAAGHRVRSPDFHGFVAAPKLASSDVRSRPDAAPACDHHENLPFRNRTGRCRKPEPRETRVNPIQEVRHTYIRREGDVVVLKP